jgi:nucleoside-diphosphate-sugar epimerase
MAFDFGTDLVLVTGGSGWLGHRLVETLLTGLPDSDPFQTPPARLRLRLLVPPGQDARSLTQLSDQIEVVHGDVRAVEDAARFCAGGKGAVLFHLAGVIHPRRVREFYAINVDGTKTIVDAAVRAGVRRAVVMSSNSPCGCNPHAEHRFDEASPYHPYLHYGRSKMLMEQAVRERQQTGAIETVLVRAPWFYGPYQPPRQTRFFRMIRDGTVPVVGDGSNRRSMAYLDNLCQGLFLAATVPQANSRTYWIADERPYPMNEILDTVEHLLEQEFGIECAHRRVRLPGFLSGLAHVADRALQGVGLYHTSLHVLSEMNKTIACDIARARAELGY